MKFDNLEGQTFGKWKVLHRTGLKPNGKKKLRHWVCQCECGKIGEIPRNHLVSGKSKQCRNCRWGIDPELNTEKLHRNGVTIVERIGGNKSTCYKCICVCGKIRKFKISYIKNLSNSLLCQRCSNNLNKSRDEHILNMYWDAVKQRAFQRGLEVDNNISSQDLLDIFESQNARCALSNIKIIIVENYKENRKQQTASLDRIDSRNGYIKGNLQWVYKKINFMKQNLDESEFFELCLLIVKNMKVK